MNQLEDIVRCRKHFAYGELRDYWDHRKFHYQSTSFSLPMPALLNDKLTYLTQPTVSLGSVLVTKSMTVVSS